METEGFLTQKVCGVQGPSATPGANAETNSAGLKHSAARQRLQARHYKQSIQKIISTQNHVQPRDLCGTTNNFLLPSNPSDAMELQDTFPGFFWVASDDIAEAGNTSLATAVTWVLRTA